MEKNRIDDPHFKRAEYALLMKCKQRNASNKYESPSPNETHLETKARRLKIIKLIESVDERKQRLASDAGYARKSRAKAKQKASNAITPESSCKKMNSNYLI